MRQRVAAGVGWPPQRSKGGAERQACLVLGGGHERRGPPDARGQPDRRKNFKQANPRRARDELALSSDTAADRKPRCNLSSRSLLDTDLYKFTMWQTMLHRHPRDAGRVHASSAATSRPIRWPNCVTMSIRELDHLCTLRFRAEELAYLRSLRFISSDFVDFLRIFRFQRDSSARAATATSSRSSPTARRCT